jgi:hypothetical protein
VPVRRGLRAEQRDVAVQVGFESQILKPGVHFIGSRIENQAAFKLWVDWIQLVQPHRDGVEQPRVEASLRPGAGRGSTIRI